jgi:hypothetical protein
LNPKSPLFGYLRWMGLHVIMARARVRPPHEPNCLTAPKIAFVMHHTNPV